jgi:arylsulfatase A-like enzyme
MTSKPAETSPLGVFRSGLAGSAAWLTYGVLEVVFTTVLPWAIGPRHLFSPVHPLTTAVLFVVYAAGGFLLGAAIAAAPALRVHARAATALTLVVPFGFSYFRAVGDHIDVTEKLILSIYAAFACVLAAFCQPRREAARFLTNPWMTGLLLFIPPWLAENFLRAQSSRGKAFFLTAAVGGTLALGWFGRRLPKPAVAKVVRPVAAVAALAAGWVLGREPLVIPAPAANAAVHKKRPNVILISMDTVRADHLSIYGYRRSTSPKLQELARQAAVFTRAFASGDMTLLTHASIFTALSPSAHGAHYAIPRELPLAPEFTTLAESLAASGYSTAAVIANHGYLGHGFGLDQGFQYYDARERVKVLSYSVGYSIRTLLVSAAAHTGIDRNENGYRNAETITEEALRIVTELDGRKRPFFLFLNYMDAHEPYQPPAPFDTMYPGKDSAFDHQRFVDLREDVISGKRAPDEREKAHLISQYDGGIAYLDSQIGRFIAGLKSGGLYDNSLIIITSDHGEAFGARSLFEHGVSVYQNQIWVPLIVKYPGIREGKRIDEPVSSVDLLPTIIEVTGAAHRGPVEGVSLLRLDAAQGRAIISESYPYSRYYRMYPRFRRVLRAVIAGRYKAIISDRNDVELYDLTEDPQETVNRYAAAKDVAVGLKQKLAAYLKAAAVYKAKADVPGADALRRLKSLGYVQ